MIDLYNMLAPIHTCIHKKFEEDKTKIKGMFFRICMNLNRIRLAPVGNNDSDPYIIETNIAQGSRFQISNHSLDTAMKQLEGLLEWAVEHYAPARELISSVYIPIFNADCMDED